MAGLVIFVYFLSFCFSFLFLLLFLPILFDFINFCFQQTKQNKTKDKTKDKMINEMIAATIYLIKKDRRTSPPFRASPGLLQRQTIDLLLIYKSKII